ncbi:MAG: cysteine--tRNA ligase [Planctomycetes bacterium]|nr:cysteine--tRNA ligase [Planctomycetota bacterium]
MAISFYNTLGKTKEPFQALVPGQVRMYNCGPTVYSYAHLGNFASFILPDLLRRYLEYSGLQVLQIMNITDVGHLTDDDQADARGEDKLEKKAREEKKNPWEIARFYEDAFHEDRRILNLTPAHHYPRATEHIVEMIEIIQELLSKGLAYEAGDQVYFEIDRFPKYGLLSGNPVEELIAGKRIEEDPQKHNPLDFCLWKKDPWHIMQWDSPWGRGFPGWHIECSAMSRKYLGRVFDLHTGGEDNIFPHHECEIAQSSGGDDTICSRYWLHRRHILVDGKKMSKSLGNFYTIRDLIAKGFCGAEIRFGLLGAHYRSQYNFTFAGLGAIRESLRRLREFWRNMDGLPSSREDEAKAEVQALEARAGAADREFRAALDDDLNISAGLAEVFNFVRDAYKLAKTSPGGRVAREQLLSWDRVLGVVEHSLKPPPAGLGPLEASGPPLALAEGTLLEAGIEEWLKKRDQARQAKNFKEADRIRDLLKEKGIVIKDTPQGTKWFRNP